MAEDSEEGQSTDMAQCGACRAVVPITSEKCPECGIAFAGVSDESLGECGACKALIPLDSKSCPSCGVTFVADNVIEVLGDWLTATGLETKDLFAKFDEDGDGEITSEEFKNGLLSLRLADLPPSQIDRLVAAIDEDGNGVIDLEELSNTFGETNKPTKSVTPDESIKSDSDDDEDSAEEATDSDENSEEQDSKEEPDSIDAPEEDAEDTEDIDDIDIDDVIDDIDDEIVDEDDEEIEEEDTSEEISDSPSERSEQSLLEEFGQAILAAGLTIREVFEQIDTNDDGKIDGPELQAGIKKLLGKNAPPGEVYEFMKSMDSDEDGSIDPMEIINAIESLELNIKSDQTKEKTREFPSPIQQFLMGKKAADIYYPIIHFLAFAFITLWVVNGLGLIVDGTGGTIVYEGHTDANGITVSIGNYNVCESAPFVDSAECQGTVMIGDKYPCDPLINDDNCANSLTPLMEHSSMPKGFYADGIFMIIFGLILLGFSLFLHFVYAPKLRSKLRELKGKKSEDDNDVEDNESDDPKEEDSDDEDDDDEDDDD
ncbi:MAG TPA: hypothetical protein D7I06_03960, partial [Candidatus Poseidoniales archaeon]